MKHLALLVALALSGCATYTTKQTDISPDRSITTEVSVRTFWDSNSKLADSKAVQTDKSQSASLGGLTQSATSTNVTAQIEILLKLAKELKAGGF
jgi:uncharacterized protein YceK